VVITRKVSHCSKNERGAEAFAAFTSVAGTAVKRGVVTVTDTFLRLIKNGPATRSLNNPLRPLINYVRTRRIIMSRWLS
jgi:hypothetical protein